MEGEVRERTEAEAMTMAFTASEARAMVAGGKWKELVRSFEALASSTNTGVHDKNGNPAHPLDVLAYYFLALYRLRENEKIGRRIEGLASWIAGPTSDGGSHGEQVEPAALLADVLEHLGDQIGARGGEGGRRVVSGGVADDSGQRHGEREEVEGRLQALEQPLAGGAAVADEE